MYGYFEAVEADFQSHYGLDLREALWGERPTGARRLLALVNGLPIRGMTFRASQMKGRDWGTTDELLASLIEQVDFTNRILYSVNAKKGSKVWKPIRIPRPHDADRERERKMSNTDEMRRAFGDSVRYQGAEN
jgi:hypothetical protein